MNISISFFKQKMSSHGEKKNPTVHKDVSFFLHSFQQSSLME